MKKILLIATAALFAWTASAQDNNYRNTRDNNRNAAQAGNYRSTPENYRSAVGPRVNFYTNTGDASVGIGAYYRYSFDSHWRIEPSIYVLTEKDSSVDINFDAHYVFRIADWWGVFPQVGRQQDASLLVRFYCHRVAEEVPLHAASAAHGQLVDLLLQLVPFLSGVNA